MVFIATTSAARSTAPTKKPTTTKRLIITTQSPFICPTNTESFEPCRCVPVNDGLSLDCDAKGLDDTAMSRVLTNFNPNQNSPLVVLFASKNLLTIAPAEISRFPSLYSIVLNGNKIKALPSNAFNLPSSTHLYIGINMLDNGMTSVASGAFNIPSAQNILVLLDSNELTSFSADAFKGESTAVMDNCNDSVARLQYSFVNIQHILIYALFTSQVMVQPFISV